MTALPPPSVSLTPEDWLDADFELNDDEPLHTLIADSSDKEDDDEDWDMEMDLGKTGGAKARAVVAGIAARSELSKKSTSGMITIRPPLPSTLDEDDEDEDEGISTIKLATLRPKLEAKPLAPTIDEDFESAFALPSDLTQLSLRPLSHQSSKDSLEWGADQTSSSSQSSSDAYSTLGFDHGSASSHSTSASQPETETEDDDEDEDDLEGLVIPSGLFESGSGAKHLAKVLQMKKKMPVVDEAVKSALPDIEDGLVIDDDVDFSPGRLLLNTQQPLRRSHGLGLRSNSAPSRPLSVKPSMRLRPERAKSPINPPPSSARQLQRIKMSPSPPPRVQRTQSYQQALLSAPPSANNSFLAAKTGSLRGQKSHSGLKPASPPPASQRKLTRKASLSSLMETSQAQVADVPRAGPSSQFARYDAPTAASKAKSHSSTSRIRGLDYIVPPTRPSTPSSNPVALRLTMPTSSSRLKARLPISSVFPGSSSATPRATSPLPPRPPSSLSLRSKSATGTSPSGSGGPKLLRRPKRIRTYGDGTELDGFDDLPTDRDKETRFRVQPVGYGNRVPGASYPKNSESKEAPKGTLRRKTTRTLSSSGSGTFFSLTSTAPRTLKRAGRLDSSSKLSPSDPSPKRKKVASPVNHTRRKPTLIRHMGGTGGPKVVGEMKWNPQTLRWEGNDQALRDFDAAMAPTRPALITHLTGSSVGSPVGSFASGARRVGNMIFDPSRMCWISALAPEDDEPDVFADLADDEEDGDGWETRGGTIRAGIPQNPTPLPSDTSASTASSRIETPSPARSRTRSPSESGSDRGSRASVVYDVDDSFLEKCRQAEVRHRNELKGWRGKLEDVFDNSDRSYLYEIRALATRKY
ncbi:hypothetical protein FA95DRAFT_1636153 [Auriscalpium vulgare]|uniref:Uncharacterized protein n=1 Tax=Auriscalpium vulgare TaxID=40419 RepID=A0ACB8S2G2_9AGAM|nr:hypothetical protein FA95DRAFT_1636153 [Auriscalpium vulgare]